MNFAMQLQLSILQADILVIEYFTMINIISLYMSQIWIFMHIAMGRVDWVFSNFELTSVFSKDNGYPHDDRADKNPYPHDRRTHKDSYPHDSNNQCIILRLQLSFAMINVQLMLV